MQVVLNCYLNTVKTVTEGKTLIFPYSDSRSNMLFFSVFYLDLTFLLNSSRQGCVVGVKHVGWEVCWKNQKILDLLKHPSSFQTLETSSDKNPRVLPGDKIPWPTQSCDQSCPNSTSTDPDAGLNHWQYEKTDWAPAFKQHSNVEEKKNRFCHLARRNHKPDSMFWLRSCCCTAAFPRRLLHSLPVCTMLICYSMQYYYYYYYY